MNEVPRPVRSVRRTAALTGLVVLLVYTATSGGSLGSTDATVTYDLTVNLVERHSLALSPALHDFPAVQGPDGRYYSIFGIGQSIYNIPFYVAARTVERRFGLRLGKSDSFAKAAVALGSSVAAAGCVVLAFLFAWRLSRDERTAALSAFALAFATLLWPQAKFGFPQPLAALLLTGATYALWLGCRTGSTASLIAGGILLGCGVLTRHEFMLIVAPLGVWLIVESGVRWPLVRRRAAYIAPGLIFSMAVWMVYNFARFGNPLTTGYRPEFGLEGYYGYTLSPRGSIFLYTPIACLGLLGLWQLKRRDRATFVLFAGITLTLFAFYASLVDWPGGRSYGPRYLVPLLPFLCMPLAPSLAASWRHSSFRRLFAAAFILSAAVQLPGVLVDFAKVHQAYARRIGREMVGRQADSWPGAPIVLNTGAAFAAVGDNVRYLRGVGPRPPVAPASDTDREFSVSLAFSFDFWWMYLFYLGAIPAYGALACGIVPLVLAVAIALRMFRSFRDAATTG